MRELPVNQIICGGCLEVMKGFPDKSIDCIIDMLSKLPEVWNFESKQWEQS